MVEKYYEVEGAVFREVDGKPMEVFGCVSGEWKPYKGDEYRVKRQSNPMSLEEVQPYMAAPDKRPAPAGEEKPA